MAEHSGPTTTTAALRTVAQRKEQRRVIAGTVIGISIEWYDFFLYASAAGLVFKTLFFEPLGPQAATLLAFATVGLSFLVSITYPIGSILGGAFAPTIAHALLQTSGSTSLITYYLLGMTAVGLVAILLLHDRTGIPWGLAHEETQTQSPFIFHSDHNPHIKTHH